MKPSSNSVQGILCGCQDATFQVNKLSLSATKSHHNVYSRWTISKYHMYEIPKLGSESIQGLGLHSEIHGQQHGNYMRSELWGSAGWTTIAWRRRPCRLSTNTSSINQSINPLDILSSPDVSVRVGRKTEDKKSICSTRNDAKHFSFSYHKAKFTP